MARRDDSRGRRRDRRFRGSQSSSMSTSANGDSGDSTSMLRGGMATTGLRALSRRLLPLNLTVETVPEILHWRFEVIDGKVARGQKTRLLRDSVIIWEGSLSSLKRFKDDVREVEKGYECGIGLENYNDIKEGDIIESYELVEIRA